jgi:hypothetical protein
MKRRKKMHGKGDVDTQMDTMPGKRGKKGRGKKRHGGKARR